MMLRYLIYVLWISLQFDKLSLLLSILVGQLLLPFSEMVIVIDDEWFVVHIHIATH